MKQGGVIGSDHVRHPLKPMSGRTRARLLQLARDMDLIALRWYYGNVTIIPVTPLPPAVRPCPCPSNRSRP